MQSLAPPHDCPVLDITAYPHIVDRILDFLPFETLPTLRLVSRTHRRRANAILYRHIRISFGLYSNADVLDPYTRRRIPGLVLDRDKDPHQFLRSLARMVAHTRIIDHHRANSRQRPPDWIRYLATELPDTILHRVDVTPNRYDGLSPLVNDATAVAMSYRLSFDRTGHLDRPWLGLFYKPSRTFVLHLTLPAVLDLGTHSRESVWGKAAPPSDYFANGVNDVTIVVTQGSVEPPRWSTPDTSDTSHLFDRFMSALLRFRCQRVAFTGLETVDPGLLGFDLQPEVGPEDRLAMYRAVIDEWIEAAGAQVRSSAPRVEVLTVGAFRAERGIDDHRWAVMTASVQTRMPLPTSWAEPTWAV